jgi:hypothetical protein
MISENNCSGSCLLDTLDDVTGVSHVLGENGIPLSGENFCPLVVFGVCLTSAPYSSSEFGLSSGFEFPENSLIHWLECSRSPRWDKQ